MAPDFYGPCCMPEIFLDAGDFGSFDDCKVELWFVYVARFLDMSAVPWLSMPRMVFVSFPIVFLTEQWVCMRVLVRCFTDTIFPWLLV